MQGIAPSAGGFREGLIIMHEVWRDLEVLGGKAPCKHGGYTGERLGETSGAFGGIFDGSVMLP